MTRAQFFETITAAVASATNSSPSRPKEITRGGLYAIEIPCKISDKAYVCIKDTLAPYEKDFGVKFLVLDGGATLRDPKAPVINVNVTAPAMSDEEIGKALRREIGRSRILPTGD